MTICKKCNKDMGYIEKIIRGKMKKVPRWKCQSCSFDEEIKSVWGFYLWRSSENHFLSHRRWAWDSRTVHRKINTRRPCLGVRTD